MLPRFSVKKPFTVLVCVVLAIVLGVVSFTNMTPDLLPNIDLHYVIVVTAAPGMNPETVEAGITKPIESSAAALDNVESVTSSSSENVSLVMIAFSDDADMDVAMMNLREKLSAVAAGWDDTVGTPQMLKINPSMLPTNVSAVYSEDMDIAELSAFVSDTLMSSLEGIDGVASVTASGLYEQYVTVTFDEARMSALNESIRAAIDEQFADAKEQLADAESELNDGLERAADGQESLDSARSRLADAKRKARAQLSEAESGLDTSMAAVLQGQLDVIAGMEEIDDNIDAINSTVATLTAIKAQAAAINAGISELDASITLLTGYQAGIAQAEGTLARLNAEIAEILDNAALSDTEKEAQRNAILASEEYVAATETLSAIDAALAERNMTRADIAAAIATAQTQRGAAEAALTDIDTALAQYGTSLTELDASIAALNAAKSDLNDTRAQLEATLTGLRNNEAELEDALKQLEELRQAAETQFSAAGRKLTAGQDSLDEALGALNDAADELNSAKDELDDAVEAAYLAADMNGIVTVSTVSKILYAQNFSMPAGYAEDNGDQILVSVSGLLEDEDDIGGLLLFDLGLDGVDPIYLSDVAAVATADNSGEIYARLNGTDGVLLVFNKQSDRSTAEVSANVLAEFDKLSETYPGIEFAPLMDQGTYIDVVIGSVIKNVLIGAGLAVIILLLFLRDLRPTFVVACSIPISLMFAIVLMYFSGVTINIISMAGLAVGVGMLVDNSIVVIENIYRLRREGVPASKAAIDGAREVSGAIIASTLTTVAVFAPIVFVTGLTRQLFTDLVLTVAYSLLASLIVALTLVPAMASGTMIKTRETSGKLHTKIVAAYERSLAFVLSHKAPALILAVLLLVSSAYVSLSKGFIYMPDMDSTQMMITFTLDEDAEVAETAAVGDEIVDRVRTLDGVDTVGVMLSSGLASVIGVSRSTTTYEGTVYVVLDDDRAVTSAELGRTIEELCGDLDCELEVASGSMTDSMSMLSGSGIEVTVYGSDLEKLSSAARGVAAALEELDSTADVSDGQENNTRVLQITVDKNAAMENGLTVIQVYAAVAEALTTEATAATLEESGRDILVISDEDGLTTDDVMDLEIRVTGAAGTVSLVKLADIAAFSEAETMSAITRQDQRRCVTVTASLKDGYNVTLATAEAERAVGEVELPDGVTLEFTGENESIMSAMKDLLTMLLLGILIVYLIMVAQFQSLLSPLIVMFTVPLAFTGGLFALAAAGLEVSIVAMIGFIMLVGIIVNNGIVLIDCANRLRAGGLDRREAIAKAGALRMRPIMMTALTTVLGLVPLALQIGMGASLMQPIAVACIGGLIYATLMTLYIVPVMYDLLVKRPPRTVEE